MGSSEAYWVNTLHASTPENSKWIYQYQPCQVAYQKSEQKSAKSHEPVWGTGLRGNLKIVQCSSFAENLGSKQSIVTLHCKGSEVREVGILLGSTICKIDNSWKVLVLFSNKRKANNRCLWNAWNKTQGCKKGPSPSSEMGGRSSTQIVRNH